MRTERLLGGAAVLALAGLGVAQTQTFVSPVAYANTEGPGSNGFPINSGTARRYQQIHSDFSPGTYAFSKVSFRPNGSTTSRTYTATRALDCEMFMGFGVSYDKISSDFAANYITPRTPVITRKVINLPALGTVSTAPAPFSIDLTLDTPFTFAGSQSLVWELVVYSNVRSSGSWVSSDVGRGAYVSGTAARIGMGCTVSGQSGPFLATATVGDQQGQAFFGVAASRAPANAPLILAVGSTDPNTPIPGLCSNLHTDLLLFAPAGVASATGSIPYWSGFAVHAPNVFAGQTLYAQLHAVDAGRSDPFKIANSNGVSGTFPSAGTETVKVSRMFNSSGGTTATQGLRFSSSSVGYGMVTQFTY